MKKVVFIICVIAALYQSACQQKMICPAYHSYFIMDVDETRSKFSLFGPDSLPKKNWEVDKKKYGIAREVSDAQKLKEMRVISMESVYKKIEDPMERFQRERMEAMASADTTVRLDSAAVMARSRGDDDIKNIDQMIYLHHFGKYLPRKGGGGQDELREDLKPEEKEEAIEGSEDQEKPEKKKGLWPFGRKKKKNKEADSGEEDAQEP